MNEEGRLQISSNRGRYMLDDEDLTSGDVLEIRLGDVWIAGAVEHAAVLYANVYEGNAPTPGYYFTSNNGSVCGLCAGMWVRRP